MTSKTQKDVLVSGVAVGRVSSEVCAQRVRVKEVREKQRGMVMVIS